MKKLLFLSCLLLTLSGTSRAEDDQDVNFIGLDEAGKEINIPMKRHIWNKKTKEVLKRVGGETLAGLRNTVATTEKFALSEIDLGLNVKMQVGIADLVSATVEPYFHLAFKK
jgi:hypothetical protein